MTPPTWAELPANQREQRLVETCWYRVGAANIAAAIEVEGRGEKRRGRIPLHEVAAIAAQHGASYPVVAALVRGALPDADDEPGGFWVVCIHDAQSTGRTAVLETGYPELMAALALRATLWWLRVWAGIEEH